MNSEKKPTWYILGAGAIGCLWAGSLRLAGFPVVIISRTTTGEANIELTANNKTQNIAVAHMSIDDLLAQQQNAKSSAEKIHYLLVATKAQQTLAAITSVRAALAPSASILIVQNGMAALTISDTFPQYSVFAGISTDGAYRTNPLAVTHAGKGETVIGSYQNQHDVQALINQLPSAQLTIHACDNIVIRQWQKLAVNAAINGLTVIYQCRNGELLQSPTAVQQIQALCDETAAITQALGLPAEVADNLFQRVCNTLTLTADNYSSMHQDIQQGRSTEIDFINGYICQQAKKLGLSCAKNQQLVATIKQIEQLGQ